jgi:two-component system CheB/CheR fusion protein
MVAVGASAGGLEAIAKFLAAAPKDSKLAFLVVVHLDPHHESRLPELLQRHTSLPTSVMKDGAVVTPGTVMVCPPSRIPSVVNGRIELTETAGGGSPNLPIDTLFRSVAIDCGEHCVGVVLSGTGSDGTRGIIAIKGEGGLVLVQDEATAAFSGMPQSAAETGLADAVGTPEELAGHLSAVGDHRSRLAPTATDAPQLSELGQIMDVLRRQTGHDFTPYKATTLARRIERRMAVTRTATVAEYAALMQRSPDEAQVLFGELLIGVTSFFRDSEAFAALGRSALPELVASLDGGAKVRVWVPACSTGEEVYSLAMVLTETLDAVGSDVGIQIFGTDLNQNAIDRARAGIYPAGIESDIDGRRLERFFQRDDHGFRVRRELREQVVFSVHDVLRDPPFSRLHLVSCRNLLIYLGADAQRRLLPLLHYTLVDGGLLFLGPSESIAGSSTLFAPVVPKWKIYRRRDSESSGAVDYVFPTGNRFASMATRIGGAPPEDANGSGQITALARDLLLRQATPTAVVVSSEGRVVFIHGRTGRYLEPPEGRMSDNLVELAREGLRLELASALRHAATSKTTVSRTGIRVMVDDLVTWTDVVVEPAEGPSPLSDALLVILRPGISPVAVEGDATATSDGRIPALERELQRSRDSQHAVVEQLQASNEELKALNEEMQSSFEELQSTNEELESTKEEQQSLNEELVTVNAELQAKLDELSRIQDDMANLLDGIRVATLFLNADLSIKRFGSIPGLLRGMRRNLSEGLDKLGSSV